MNYCSTKVPMEMHVSSADLQKWWSGWAILINSAISATLHSELDRSSKTSTIFLLLFELQHSSTRLCTVLMPFSFKRCIPSGWCNSGIPNKPCDKRWFKNNQSLNLLFQVGLSFGYSYDLSLTTFSDKEKLKLRSFGLLLKVKARDEELVA